MSATLIKVNRENPKYGDVNGQTSCHDTVAPVV